MELQDNNLKGQKMPKKVYVRGEICRFIEKLWSILQVSLKLYKNPSYSHILQWNNCGRTFTINSITLLQRNILPLYFRHSQLKSFVRQLNMYDFRKSQRDKQLLVFYNHNFKRDEPNRLHLIRRKLAKRERVEIQNEGFNEEMEENEENQIEWGRVEKEEGKIERQALQIRSYGRLIEGDHMLIPFVSPFSHCSIPSLPCAQDQLAWESLQAQFGNQGSTNAEQWGTGFTSCQYFI